MHNLRRKRRLRRNAHFKHLVRRWKRLYPVSKWDLNEIFYYKTFAKPTKERG